jgi:hypothetical protein
MLSVAQAHREERPTDGYARLIPSQQIGAESSVVGVLVLIGASVLMATVILFWAQSTIGQSQSSASANILRSNIQASEQFNIDDVLFGSTTTKVYARNFGDVPVRIKAVYIIDLGSGSILNSNPELPDTQVILPRTASSVPIPFNPSPHMGKMVAIRLASDTGNAFQETFRVG